MKIKNSAITLVELIVSTLIVSMVVAGVFSADYALRRTSENSATDTQTSVQTKALAEGVRGAMKVLHGFPSNPGITIPAPMSTNKTICFRHDIVVAGNFTPDNYADDNHTCFTQIGTSVYRCEKSLVASACAASDLLIGTLVSDQFTNGTITALGPTVTANATTGEYSFRMTFVSRRDPTAGAAITAGALTSGTDANPQTVVQVWENAAGF